MSRTRNYLAILVVGSLAVALVQTSAIGAPKQVGKRKLQWNALPGFGPAYTLYGSGQAACDKNPTAYGYTGGAVAVPAWPGNWSDIVVKVPRRISGLVPFTLSATITNQVGEWDLFICKVVGNRYVFISTNAPASICPPPGFGCTQNPKAAVKPGETYVLRAYNWLAPPTAAGELFFMAK